MNNKKFFPLLLVALLSSCSSKEIVVNGLHAFDTFVDFKLFEGNETDKNELISLINDYDHMSDNYKLVAGINNVSSINSTNEEVEIDARLYTMLTSAFKYHEYHAYNFNPLCGSLAKKWKESLQKGEILSQNIIDEELIKMNNSALEFMGENKVKRVGEAEIDLGGLAKGYVLDEIYGYLVFHNINHYLVNAGSSSILLGKKNNNDGYFTVGINEKILPNSYLKLKDCFVSTSSLVEQGVKIGDITYSHIINPTTGDATNLQEAVIVVSSSGYKGDALSTSLVNCSLEEIKQVEQEENIKVIVVNNKTITYKSESLEVYKR